MGNIAASQATEDVADSDLAVSVLLGTQATSFIDDVFVNC